MLDAWSRVVSITTLVSLLVPMVPNLARAQEGAPTSRTGGESASERAEQLYEQGKSLAAAGNYASACPLFEESQRLEPAIGTQFNLADCYERVGRRASALALFREVIRVAQMSGKQERQRAAEDRARSLQGNVRRIVITVDSLLGEQHVRVDGREVGADERTAGIPVDPGTHRIDSDAPMHVAWQTTLDVDADGAAPATVRIPPLPAAATQSQSSPLMPLGIGIAGLGALALGLGALTGLGAAGAKRDAGCDGLDCSHGGDATKLREAQSSGDLSTVAFVAGGVLVAGGVTIILLAPKRTSGGPPSASAAVGPRGMILRGSF